MPKTQAITLNPRQRAIVSGILAAAQGRIGAVKVFGSRATGRARPASDLDLVVFEPAPPDELARLRQAFDESLLPITVDLVAWDRIDSAAMRAEIERDAVPWELGE
ncbi:MAG: nucleotidyltransferase domain-containing protein [Sphingomonadales bacterium]|nr:nucleotidyltransferase domain-containing protein [Sphingomonadales bacterium]